MAIISTISESEFYHAFEKRGRADSWSYEGLSTLHSYLSDDDLGGIELDVIGIDCEFCEYHNDDLEQAFSDNGVDTLEELRDKTLVLTFTNGIVLQSC